MLPACSNRNLGERKEKGEENMRSIRLILALLLLLVFAFANHSVSGNMCAQSCVLPPAGLVGWWPGDGNADDLACENDGTLRNGATFGPGMVGQSFSLDGLDDYVDVPSDSSLDPSYALTVDAWINPSSHVGAYDPIVKKAGEGLSQENGYALAAAIASSWTTWWRRCSTGKPATSRTSGSRPRSWSG
jgi:hypothetical protein